ncbi:hypothetical protein DPMN_138999 [Dreissena polymorpha]|uniref:Uncharacterized protein n=1 Tax=Dreissena polymorpha TaxID=45954 RepID=A0A9D4JF88_DREPO|nr:hypothetical protein DPMN_138999 [Dreissena polymorpha]
MLTMDAQRKTDDGLKAITKAHHEHVVLRRALYISMDQRVGDLWDQYDNHDIVCEEFLTRVGEIYGRI